MKIQNVMKISDPGDQIFGVVFHLHRAPNCVAPTFVKCVAPELNKQTQSFRMHKKLLEFENYEAFWVEKCMLVGYQIWDV